jgi:anti-sigma regulatory factor (Ser/Thr protein kinase)
MTAEVWNRRFPRDVAALDSIFNFVRAYLDHERLDPRCAFDIDLVVEELFTNLVRHNRGNQEIEIGLGRLDGDVTLTLRDFDVEPFDPTRGAAVPDEGTHLAPGGRGILLVQRLSKEFTYDYGDRTSTLTARLDVHREGES